MPAVIDPGLLLHPLVLPYYMLAMHPDEHVSSNVAIITPDGNVILVIGPPVHAFSKFLVHTSSLTKSSPVFSAMFGPYFKEGQPSDQNSPKEIPLPDNDPRAMALMCLVLHGQDYDILGQLRPRDVFLTAQTCDKYDCIDNVKLVSSSWLEPDYPVDVEDLGYFAAAAYLFDQAKAFELLPASGRSGLWVDISLEGLS